MLVRRIRKRGATSVVEAHGEILFTHQGDVGVWKARFSRRVREFAAQAAPSNKRPRWAHYGEPLRDTFTASTTYQPGRMRVYSAIGSTAPYAYYVDQGTGVFAGNQPYKAKILPPWAWGDASLYEHTWRPGGPGKDRVRPVLIQGQKGKFFFDEGLRRGFQNMRMRSYQVPGDARITDALRSVPSELLAGSGRTPNTPAFQRSLDDWRDWRDEAYAAREVLGKDGGRATAEMQRRYERAQKAAASRAQAKSTKKTKPTKPTKPTKTTQPTKQTKPQKTPVPDISSASVQEKVANSLRAQGITPNRVRSIRIKTDGTYTFLFRKPSGVWVPRKGRWKT